MSFSSIIQWIFQVRKTRKRKREKRRQRTEKRSEIHFCENHCERIVVFIILIFERGFLLEESILTKVCYWVSSRLCTGLSFCANQGVFLNPSWSCLNQDLRCIHCNFVKFIERFVLVWALEVSLCFLLKLIGSCGEQFLSICRVLDFYGFGL